VKPVNETATIDIVTVHYVVGSVEIEGLTCAMRSAGASCSVHCCSLSVVWLMTFVHITIICINWGMSSSPKVRSIFNFICH